MTPDHHIARLIRDAAHLDTPASALMLAIELAEAAAPSGVELRWAIDNLVRLARRAERDELLADHAVATSEAAARVERGG